MSKALKCDRCGKLFEPNGCHKYDTLVLKSVDSITNISKSTRICDICPECSFNVHKWLNNLDEKNVNENE